jgi:hypothetical protein
MKIEVALTLGDGELQRLADETGWPVGEVQKRLSLYGGAAVQEFADMLTGEVGMDRAADVREHRLMLLIIHGGGGIPSEAEVSRMFHMTLSAARALLRRVLSRYRTQIGNARRISLEEMIGRCRSNDKEDTYYVVVEDRLLVDAANEELARLSLREDVYTRLMPHDAERVEYKMSSRSYDALKNVLEKLKEVPGK